MSILKVFIKKPGEQQNFKIPPGFANKICGTSLSIDYSDCQANKPIGEVCQF